MYLPYAVLFTGVGPRIIRSKRNETAVDIYRFIQCKVNVNGRLAATPDKATKDENWTDTARCLMMVAAKYL
jgi:hypothetical protein